MKLRRQDKQPSAEAGERGSTDTEDLEEVSIVYWFSSPFPAVFIWGYANASGFARILALTALGEKVFEYAYPADGCNDGYRSLPIHWENLKF